MGDPSRRRRRTPVAPVERILGGPGRLRILLPPPRCHPSRPGCSGAHPGIIPGENVLEDADCSRCFQMSSVCPGMGPVYSRRTPVVDASRSHPGPTGAAEVYYSFSLYMGCIFTYNSIHIKSNQMYLHNKIINIVWQNGMHLHVPKHIIIVRIHDYIKKNIIQKSLYTFTCTKNILHGHITNTCMVI